ncbi:hypothetical protein E2493_10195 [Sphingomonas parva]|uniref:Uncharacterized protein n=1 Tax=Sphingomonas parva TaxID=2555898 RepID=A0A4Y8ZQQ2_9SPHN|nr:hypothetical protein [Sphingomonas parva]TFI58348.1 hypothetical protein E2493_10195 [Sphingomonas parva]
MDLAFLRRAEQRFARRTAITPDPDVVSALREVQRAASAAARAEALLEAPRVRDPIAEILLAGPGWRRAVAAQKGSFNPDLAGRIGGN